MFLNVTSNFFSFAMKGYIVAYIHCHQIIFWTTISAWRKLPPELPLMPALAQRWHPAGSTGTRSGPVQLNASEALLCVWSRTPSSTRPAGVVWVAGPGWYERDAERSHGTCDGNRMSLFKIWNIIQFQQATSPYSSVIFPHSITDTFSWPM